ncbi:T9SS-dependent choice-of-anchor J family protein [Flavobacterium terrigena]|uniref:Por secretion system C-terminal sorting domain-containing protein n=1 Tax=Flavobacterium terrigena TaxID=402734 RepID=A0A1H6QAP0_9FLAO|nr:choice-of-anchor J domain-containing protein [Flavobacterium terrigena]SEI40829.1 Por secretion system C-terminal sorting domain-containing protein [Flavobacterium terrigena]
MKKITLWLFLLIGFVSFSQINISQTFATTATPAGWNVGGGVLTNTQACATSSWRFRVSPSSSTTTNTLASQTFVSTGESINVSFDYKVVNGTAPTVATTPYDGTIVVETSSDNGVTFGNAVVAVNNANHVVANTCANKSVIIPGSSTPNGANTKIRIKCNFGTSGDYYVYLDNIVITQAAASPCSGVPSPGNTLAPSSVCFGSSAILSLQNYTSGSGVTYQWYLNAVAISGATSYIYTIPSVTSSGTYYCVVTCSGNTTASNSVIVAPSILNAPLLEPFATFLPTCWTNMVGGNLTTGPTTSTGSTWVADGFANVGTTGAIRNYIDAATANDWVISPVITIPAAGYELKFEAAATQVGTVNTPTTAWESDDYIEVLVATGGSTANWNVVYTYNDLNVPSNTGIPNIIDLTAYAGQNIRIAFRAVEGASNGAAAIDFSIDNFQVRLTPACSEPVNIFTTNISDATFDMTWTEAATLPSVGYEYVVSTSNTVPVVNGTSVATNFASPTGLLSDTTYYIFVRSDCGGTGYSPWIGPVSVKTDCVPFSAPFSENFTTFLPSSCWFNRRGGDLTTEPTILAGSRWVADGFANVGTTGAIKSNIFTNSANSWFISPRVTIPTTGYQLKFDAAATQYATINAPTNAWEADDSIQVLVSTSGGLTNWTVIYTYDSSNQPSNTGTPNVINLDDYAGQNIRIAFRALEGTTDGTADIDFSIDNFQISLTPLCPDQTGLVIGDISSSGASVSWDDLSSNGSIGYEYAITTSATPPTSGTPTTATFYIASGLTPQTVYYLHVRSECTGSVYGNWATISFTTTCSSSTALPWLENFDALATGTNIFPSCWSYSNTADSWSISTAPVAYSGANSLRRAFSSNGWAFTPMFTLTAGTSYVFSYYVRTNDSSVGYDITVGVGTSQLESAMTTTLSSVVGYYGPTWKLVTVGFTPSVSGDYTFGVKVIGTFVVSGINFDNFELKLAPTNDNCANAIALTPGATFGTNPLVATNVAATGSTETAPGCASYTGGDVWYSVVVPASGNVTIATATNTGTTITDTGLAIYSGSCGSLVLVSCDDNTGAGNFSLVALTGRTPGEVLKVRTWENGNDIFNTFQISAYDATLSSASFDSANFVAYPNPVKDVLNLSYKTAISNVKVINLLGQEVLNTKTNSNDVQVNMSALTAGAYIVNINVEDTVHTIKVIKQ